MKRLIVFDLDGVLLDSHDNMRRSWEVVLEKTDVGRSFEDYFGLIGRPFQDIMRILEVEGDTNWIEKVYMTASFDFLTEAKFFDGVRETLASLEAFGVKLAVVTSKDQPRTKAVLTQLDVNFTSVQCPDGVLRGKPAPDHLLVAIAESGEDPGDALFVGDMETDWQTAVRAGVDYVHADWGYGNEISEVTSLDSIRGILRFVRSQQERSSLSNPQNLA